MSTDSPTIYADRDAAINAMRAYLGPLGAHAAAYDLDKFADMLLVPNPAGAGYIFDATEDKFATTLDMCEYA